MPHETAPHERERAIQRLAARQHRCVTGAQLAALGVSAGVLRGISARGWLVREHRGVYRVGPEPLGRGGRWAAALLAVGPASALSHRTAGEVYGWLEYDPRLPVHVTAPGRRRWHRGVVVHEASVVGQRVRRRGLTVTTVDRTLADLAATEPSDVVHDAVHEAEVQRQLRPALLTAARGRPGAPLLRALGADRLPVEGGLRLRLEEDFARFRHERGYPTAETNVRIALTDPAQWVRLDVLFREHGLGVELDGRAVHATQRAFDADRRRDRRLLAQHGIEMVRATWRHVHEEADELDADLRSLLGLGTASAARNGR